MIGPWKSWFHIYPSSMYLASSVFLLNYNHFINTDIQYASMKIIIFSMVLMYFIHLRNEIFTVASHIKYEISEFHCWRRQIIVTQMVSEVDVTSGFHFPHNNIQQNAIKIKSTLDQKDLLFSLGPVSMMNLWFSIVKVNIFCCILKYFYYKNIFCM